MVFTVMNRGILARTSLDPDGANISTWRSA